ncbi:MAG: hypothetical protein ACT6T3_22210, partial [Agrobacterium sp.]|uniref:hypothetical protein n=1 Tax=Agrobacterium sp. TaxID=361 RepID=UPI0040332EFB
TVLLLLLLLLLGMHHVLLMSLLCIHLMVLVMLVVVVLLLLLLCLPLLLVMLLLLLPVAPIHLRLVPFLLLKGQLLGHTLLLLLTMTLLLLMMMTMTMMTALLLLLLLVLLLPLLLCRMGPGKCDLTAAAPLAFRAYTAALNRASAQRLFCRPRGSRERQRPLGSSLGPLHRASLLPLCP